MTQHSHNKMVAFIWSIADDILRDVYVRGKYRDVILPMVVLRRLDALLEPTKAKVMEEVDFQVNELGNTPGNWDDKGLEDASGYVFYNTSKWTLQKLYNTATNNQKLLLGNFEDYLNGFSDNVKEIIDKFKLYQQIRHMADKDILLNVLEAFTSPHINFSPVEKKDPEGNVLPPLTNLGMGYVFEELIRRFNEENNEEAGEHFTPREVINLMTHLVFEPLKNQLPPVMTIYDPACGTGGMLTESENYIKNPEGEIKTNSDIYLYGKEINDETYAICKSDMMIKGDDPENIRLGSTLATDEFAGTSFDFMLSNPPYGKSWKSDEKYIKDGKDILDPRFKVVLNDYWQKPQEVAASPRISDGQLLFLMEMVDKMKDPAQNTIGSRVASVHNGSALFTGDAGGGESNIRRYIIENDWLDTIIQLPNNLFYNTGITTYIWLLNNHKPAQRRGKVLLIDASQQYRKLRKNLGNKNCELAPEHIAKIQQAYAEFKTLKPENDTDLAAKVFNNADFGYYKVTIERPLRLKAAFTPEHIDDLRYDKSLKEPMQWALQTFGEAVYNDVTPYGKDIIEWSEVNSIELNAKKRKSLLNNALWQKHQKLYKAAKILMQHIGNEVYDDFNDFKTLVTETVKKHKINIDTTGLKNILSAVSWYDENAAKVLKKTVKLKGKKLDVLLKHLGTSGEHLPDFGYYATGNPDTYNVYEPYSELRDYENVPLNTSIHDYFLKEVKPYVPEAWIDLDKTKIGYEISFNKYFYRHKPLPSLEEVRQEISALEKENEGLIQKILDLTVK